MRLQKPRQFYLPPVLLSGRIPSCLSFAPPRALQKRPHEATSSLTTPMCSFLSCLALVSFIPFIAVPQNFALFCTPGWKSNFVWIFFLFPKSSDSDRGPAMRGVDSRGGGYPGEGGNPPSGGRGRGMVLPAWMTNQQTPQSGGPVSYSPLQASTGRVLCPAFLRMMRYWCLAMRQGKVVISR